MEVLLDKKRLIDDIQNNNLDEILNMLDCIDDEEYDILVEGYECLNNILYKNFRNRGCSEFIKILDKQRYQKKHLINLDQDYYMNKRKELLECNDKEKMHTFQDLLLKKCFNSGLQLCIISHGEGYRFVDSDSEWKELLILFANVAMKEEIFAKKITSIYDLLIFDKEIVKSMKRLKAGLDIRRPEILYHLYQIESTFPQIYEKGKMGNVQAGKEFENRCGIECSPERRINQKQMLIKKIEGIDIKCDMHTKMKKYGGQKPDRIYFNPCVDENVIIDGKSIKGKIYIYKITEHV